MVGAPGNTAEYASRKPVFAAEHYICVEYSSVWLQHLAYFRVTSDVWDWSFHSGYCKCMVVW